MKDIIEINPLDRLDATVRVPGSKSYTQRALVIASLAEGKSILRIRSSPMTRSISWRPSGTWAPGLSAPAMT